MEILGFFTISLVEREETDSSGIQELLAEELRLLWLCSEWRVLGYHSRRIHSLIEEGTTLLWTASWLCRVCGRGGAGGSAVSSSPHAICNIPIKDSSVLSRHARCGKLFQEGARFSVLASVDNGQHLGGSAVALQLCHASLFLESISGDPGYKSGVWPRICTF